MMRACSGVLGLLLVTGTLTLDLQDIVTDIRELRREVEQVRNEVRREEGGSRESDNQAVLLSWLVETVKELQSEMRSLESKLNDGECAQSEDVLRLQSQLDILRQNNKELKEKEEKDFTAVEEMTQKWRNEKKVRPVIINRVMSKCQGGTCFHYFLYSAFTYCRNNRSNSGINIFLTRLKEMERRRK